MSYNNNFSYFNVPTSSNDWWGAKDKTPSFEDRVVKIDYNNQPYAQNYMQNYAQSMILPSENRVVEQVHPRHEVLQGTVTQLFTSFGYINDNIIFSKTDVSGPMVKVGDRVAVDATYQPNNPTKYKGERVCKIDDSRFNSSSSGLSKMKPLSRDLSTRIDIPLNFRQESGKFDGKKSDNKSDSIYDNMDLNSDVSSPMVKVSDRIGKIDDSRFNSSSSGLSKMRPLSRDLAARIDIPLNYRPESGKFEGKIDKRSDNKSAKKFNKIDSARRSSASKETKTPESKRYPKGHGRASSPIDLTSDVQKKPIYAQSPKQSLKRKASSSSKSIKPPIEAEKKSSPKTTADKLPKQIETFALRELDCASLKFRCKNLEPPNQFFHASLKYQQTFPLNHPMKLGNACHFKVMDKKVKSIDNYINDQLNRDIDPEDADTTFSAKVMLLSTDELAEFYKQILVLAEEFDGASKVPMTKAIKFLVGSLGSNKEFAFGGAWSQSLDGSDPDNNPRVLINTAIRTCKNLTGIDLSGCSSWPKFLELHYYRPLQKLQKKTIVKDNKSDLETESEERFEYIEPRMETVVYYVPDIWNCIPSQESWNDIKRMYQEQLTSLMCPPPSIPFLNKPASTNNINQDGDQPAKKSPGDNQEEEDYNFNENEEIDEKSKDSEQLMTDEQPTHFSNLNVDGLKIVEIKKELELRKLSVKGVMDQLKARLKSALEKEETEEKLKGIQVIVKPAVETKSIPENILSDVEKKELKQHYSLPDTPHIIVHQNQKFKDNTMRIKTMSLHSLLSYYDMKLDESTFEVALFAKQFLEMLRRDAVFNIYKSLVVTPEADLSPKEENPSKKPKLMVTTSKRTVNRPLLFSCIIMDREKTNKIPLDDLKCMIEGLGICLSSDQLTGLLEKIKDSSKCLHYRLLTDKEIDDNDITKMLATDQTDDLDYIRELAMGNKALFEEGIAMDNSVDNEEVDRLKNELDKSERCRQTLELRFAEIKEEAEKTNLLMQAKTKEIQKLKDQITEYRTKYHNEQDRGDYYKKDFDKIFRDLKDIDKLAASLGKSVTDSIERYKKSDSKPTTKPDTSKSKSVTKSRSSDKISEVSSKSNCELDCEIINEKIATPSEEQPVKTNQDENSLNCDVDMSESVSGAIDDEKDEDEGPNEKSEESAVEAKSQDDTHNNLGHEDFELSKPSDYEIIILDETE